VDYPRVDRQLLRVVASGASRIDVELIIEADAAPFAEDGEASREAALARRRHAVMDARHRVRALMRQSVEAMRLATTARWKRSLQLTAFIISTILAVAAFLFAHKLTAHPVIALGESALAGFLAPVARDLLAAIENLRT
jgi:hypothetical protein